MSLHDAGVVAGMISTSLFVLSYLPMLVKAGRSRDLASYSLANLAIANVGNLVHSVYVFSLPAGPIWVLHSFYLVSTALMLVWWWRFHWVPLSRTRPEEGAAEAARPWGDRPDLRSSTEALLMVGPGAATGPVASSPCLHPR